MTDYLTLGIIGCILLIVLIFSSVHIGFALVLVGFVGVALMRGMDGAFGLFRTVAYFNTANYSLTPLPLFVLMSGLCTLAGISGGLFDSMAKWLSGLRAPLGVAVAAASAVFGMLTGTSMVVAAMFTQLALPEMLKAKYNRQFSAGIIAGSSILGMLIPPSLFAILYGILANESIGKLFVAGIVPGLVTLVVFSIYIVIAATRNPALAPPSLVKYTMKDRVASLKGIWPMLLVAIIMLGGIFSGIFTVTEGASVGVIGAIIVLLAIKKLTWKVFMQAAMDTVKINCMIAILLVGVTMFSRFIAMSGVTQAFADWLVATGLPPKVVLLLFMLLYLVLGCFLDVIGMLAVTVPILLPLQVTFGWDPIYLGIVVIYSCLVGTLTPPVGLTLFATKGAAVGVVELPFNEIVKGVIPFVAMMAGIALLLWWIEPLAIGFAKYM